jgi:hypothetical protein
MYDSPAYVWAIIIAGPKAWRPPFASVAPAAGQG